MARMGYRATLDWMRQNDDTEWVFPPEGEEPIPSVTAVLTADIFDKQVEDVISDLRRNIEKHWPQPVD